MKKIIVYSPDNENIIWHNKWDAVFLWSSCIFYLDELQYQASCIYMKQWEPHLHYKPQPTTIHNIFLQKELQHGVTNLYMNRSPSPIMK